jgi:hypothetical protein
MKKLGIKDYPTPNAWITVNKARRKIYLYNNVYLDNGTEFEIELFNPTSERVLAYISINGKKMGRQGLILKPGQRFYLDRFLQENRKLLYETYEVENSEVTKKAIENNGEIIVEFYKEKEEPISITYSTSTISTPIPTIDPSPRYLFRNTVTSDGSCDVKCRCLSSKLSTNCVTNANYSSSDIVNDASTLLSTCNTNKIETGRIEKGSISNQNFREENFISESYPCSSVRYKIYPTSDMPLETKVLNESKKYCPECGKKVIKKGFKYCPECGKKIN